MLMMCILWLVSAAPPLVLTSLLGHRRPFPFLLRRMAQGYSARSQLLWIREYDLINLLMDNHISPGSSGLLNFVSLSYARLRSSSLAGDDFAGFFCTTFSRQLRMNECVQSHREGPVAVVFPVLPSPQSLKRVFRLEMNEACVRKYYTYYGLLRLCIRQVTPSGSIQKSTSNPPVSGPNMSPLSAQLCLRVVSRVRNLPFIDCDHVTAESLGLSLVFLSAERVDRLTHCGHFRSELFFFKPIQYLTTCRQLNKFSFIS